MSTYKVSIVDPGSFQAPQRVRAGVVVLKQGGYEGELSHEQYAAVKADGRLSVEEVKSAVPAETKANPTTKK